MLHQIFYMFTWKITDFVTNHNLFSLSSQLDMALLHLANVLHRSHHSQDALVALRIALTSSSPSTSSSSSSTSSVYLTMGNVLAVSSLTHPFTHSLTQSLTHSPTHSPTHSLIQSHTHPPTYSLTHSPTHSFSSIPSFSSIWRWSMSQPMPIVKLSN